MMQASKKIPWEQPMVLDACRGLYIFSNLLIFGIYYVVYSRINKKKGMMMIRFATTALRPGANLLAPIDMTVIKYTEPAPLGSAEPPKPITTTVYDYDINQLKSLVRAQLMGIGMMGVMHIYFKYTNPLLIQSIIPVKGVFEGNLIQVHLLGKAAIGDLKRPWKASGGIMGAMQGGEPKTDKKSFEAAEKGGRGGAKEE
jgi:hypothetical protein